MYMKNKNRKISFIFCIIYINNKDTHHSEKSCYTPKEEKTNIEIKVEYESLYIHQRKTRKSKGKKNFFCIILQLSSSKYCYIL